MRWCLPIAVFAGPLIATADEARPAERWALSGEALVMSAPALPGVVIGGMAEGRIALTPIVHWSLRLGGGETSDSNVTWNISQTHLTVLTGFGVSRTFGKARLAAELDAGALVLLEHATRHQLARLIEAGIPDAERRSTAVAPIMSLQTSLELEFVERWSLRFSVGPHATWLSINDVPQSIAGLSTAVGVTRAF